MTIKEALSNISKIPIKTSNKSIICIHYNTWKHMIRCNIKRIRVIVIDKVIRRTTQRRTQTQLIKQYLRLKDL